jgi:hypothetical protein
MPTQHNPLRGPSDHPVAQSGVAHMTPASRHIHTLAFGRKGTATRRRGKKKALVAQRSRPHRKARATAARSASAKFVKGSPAARRHMARLRKLRGKKKAA